MHLQSAVDGLDGDRLAASVLNEEMRAGDRARAAEPWCRRRHHHDRLHSLLHLFDGGEIGEHPHAEFLWRNGVLGVLGRHLGVFGVVREIEQADGKALVVDAVENGGKPERVGADDGVARGVDEALAPVWQRAAHLLARGHDDHVRLHGEAEFEGASADRSTVLRLQADAGAGEAWCGGRGKSGN
jgi:hypothetical protein